MTNAPGWGVRAGVLVALGCAVCCGGKIGERAGSGGAPTGESGSAGTPRTNGAGGNGASGAHSSVGGAEAGGDTSGARGAGDAGQAGSAEGGAAAASGATGSFAGTGTGNPVGADGRCVPSAFKHMDGLCYCQPLSLWYCADGCFDLQSDADHCGDCTTACGPSGVCSAGKCRPAPTLVEPGGGGPCSPHLALSAGVLYWTNSATGWVNRLAINGSVAGTISSVEKSPSLIQASGNAAYWIDRGTNNSIMKSVDGAAPHALYVAPVPYTSAQNDGAINGLAVATDGSIYFSMFRSVYKLVAGNGTPLEIGHEDSGIPRALSVDEEQGFVGFPTDINGDVEVMTIGATPAVCASPNATAAINANCARLARGQGELFFDAVLLSAGRAYWANDSQIASAATNGLELGYDTLASSPDFSIMSALSFSNGKAFFVGDTGLVAMATLELSSVVTALARQQQGATSIVADLDHAYWTTADCGIMSVPFK